MHILKTKWLARFARRESIQDAALLDAIDRITRGLVDADLGGGLVKQRVARSGKGRSGGYRMILAYKDGQRAVFLYGFAKNDLENISAYDLSEFRKVGSNWLNASEAEIEGALEEGALQEVSR